MSNQNVFELDCRFEDRDQRFTPKFKGELNKDIPDNVTKDKKQSQSVAANANTDKSAFVFPLKV